MFSAADTIRYDQQTNQALPLFQVGHRISQTPYKNGHKAAIKRLQLTHIAPAVKPGERADRGCGCECVG